MKSNEILYSKGKNDECYTPCYGVEPIIKHLKYWANSNYELNRDITVRCPFDKQDSNFVTMIKEAGFNVISSHIDEGKDFFEYEPKEWDIIISNPPFTEKKKYFERCLSFGKPFALLMTLTWLNDSTPKKLFKEKDLQLLMFDKRIAFINAGKSPTFSSAYYCYNFLPKQIIMENIIKF